MKHFGRTVLVWCFLFLLAVLLTMSIYVQALQVKAIEKLVTERNCELEDAEKRFYDSQTAYYMYCLKEYMERDAESDYVYGYENWCKEELGLPW